MIIQYIILYNYSQLFSHSNFSIDPQAPYIFTHDDNSYSFTIESFVDGFDPYSIIYTMKYNQNTIELSNNDNIGSYVSINITRNHNKINTKCNIYEYEYDSANGELNFIIDENNKINYISGSCSSENNDDFGMSVHDIENIIDLFYNT